MHFVITLILSCLLHLLFSTMFATYGFGQIYHVKEMNTEQIRALGREKTVVLIPGGILEQHGPYLPSFTDGYMAERRTEELANAIVERPGWKVLVFPLRIWCGNSRIKSDTPLSLICHSPTDLIA